MDGPTVAGIPLIPFSHGLGLTRGRAGGGEALVVMYLGGPGLNGLDDACEDLAECDDACVVMYFGGPGL